ncbi:acyl carrier protein [Piedraia hortae CBS 480.64]|uniref:Acyl carrier protein n=1 Tax=Piedraia hortae CBS 480.64 TaxID=1314780 RepID=A0A6A7C492_9PEZI|nr:acyl carrier protein [Piedraia hortae CBS 480.64]
MYRVAFVRAARSASQKLPRAQRSAFSVATRARFIQPSTNKLAAVVSSPRWYSSTAGLDKDEVTGRIMALLKNFEKNDGQDTDSRKISANAHFTNDLGLDSLDTVEVVMAVEEEFSIEIPDKEADAIHSVNQAVDYIMAQPDGKSKSINALMLNLTRAAH